MPSIPHSPPEAQAESQRQALALARQLTPLQRQLVVRAGMPRWLALPAPWQPAPGRHTAAAKALCSPELGVLEPVPDHLGAYRLTRAGELAAGIWILSALALGPSGPLAR